MRESSFQSRWMETSDYFAQELTCLSSRDYRSLVRNYFLPSSSWRIERPTSDRSDHHHQTTRDQAEFLYSSLFEERSIGKGPYSGEVAASVFASAIHSVI